MKWFEKEVQTKILRPAIVAVTKDLKQLHNYFIL